MSKAFLFYFDDWLGSDAVTEMDGDEECGYLRLLVYAWKQPDCGLPNNPKLLAQKSLLDEQWDLPTRDEDYRYDPLETSGQKILKNFTERGGRLYNDRLLKEWNYQQSIREKRAKASEAGVEARRQKSAGKLFGESLEELYDEPDGLSIEDHEVNQVVDQMVNQTDNKLSLCLGLKNTSNTDKASSEDIPAVSVIAEPQGIPDRIFEIATRFQSTDGFNVPAAFKFFAVLYPREGRVRLETAFGVFATRIDESSSGRLTAFCRMLIGLDKWKASAQWERGAINHIGNWFGERLYFEEPISAKESAEKYAKSDKAPPKRESAMDRIRAKVKENESRRSA